jgi:hypothetical protein
MKPTCSSRTHLDQLVSCLVRDLQIEILGFEADRRPSGMA